MRPGFYAQKYFAASFLTAMAMVALEVAPWAAGLSLIFLLWKWGSEKKSWPLLSRRWTAAISIFLFAIILVQYRTLIGQEPAYTFLLGLSALRVMDYQNERDHKFLVLLGFVLIAIKALFSLDVYWVAPSAFAFWGLWYSLMPTSLQIRTGVLNKIFLMSLPFAIVLFVVFPRFVLPWAIARGSAYGQIGFSDDLNPGRVAEIVASTALAFRAKLDQLPLKQSKDLYWRGSVLNISKGLAWRPLRARELAPEVKNSEGPIYEVALEPLSQNFLFALAGTTEIRMETQRVQNWTGGIFRATKPVQTTSLYRGYWQTGLKDESPPGARDLETPVLQGRVLEWTQATLQSAHGLLEKRKALQTFFMQSGFQYSMTPGAYGPNDLEDFLFKRRKGFCEHFAGAYATLARALGIPARVVVGYQGGKYNPVGGFWKISQRDAHAWVEIYLDGFWQREDPTFWVAPLRIFIGGEEFFSLSEADQKAFAQSTDWAATGRQSGRLWEQVSFWMDNINYRWNDFLIDYDRGSQVSLLAQIMKYPLWIGLGVLFCGVVIFILSRNLYRKKEFLSVEQTLLRSIEKWGRQKHWPREKAEAPLSYLDRLSSGFPRFRPLLMQVYEHYDLQIYAARDSKRGSELLKEWKAFVAKTESHRDANVPKNI